MKTYFAIGHKEPGSAYGFWFPDVEGCFGTGDTYDAALKDAADALRLHVELLQRDGEEVPEPRSIDEINQDAAAKESRLDEGSFVIGVPLITPQKAKRRVSFNADAGVVTEVERQIRAYGITRTDWWVSAAHQYLGGTALSHTKAAKSNRIKRADRDQRRETGRRAKLRA